MRREFSKVFSGVGNLGDEYQIKLKEGAVPYALFTPRNVPIPLREKVREAYPNGSYGSDFSDTRTYPLHAELDFSGSGLGMLVSTIEINIQI
jgi:hypothetical protein